MIARTNEIDSDQLAAALEVVTARTAQAASRGRERAEARRAVRLIGINSLIDIVEAGGTLRRGTTIKGWQPVAEWQAFDANGEFVAPVVWTATRGFQISDLPGVNR